MATPENSGIVPEILRAIDNGELTGEEVLDAIRAVLESRKAEIETLLVRVESFIGPQLPKVVTYSDFHQLDDLFGHEIVSRAWSCVVSHALRFPDSILADCIQNGDRKPVGLEHQHLDLEIFAAHRSQGFSGQHIFNYGTRADAVFKEAAHRAGIDVSSWQPLRRR